MREHFRDMDGTQAGDPALAAAAIITAVEREDPPLRVALGEHALTTIRSQLHARLRELEAWEALGRGTDFG